MKITIWSRKYDVFESFYKHRGFTELPPMPTATGEELRHVGEVPADRALCATDREGNIGDREAVPLHEGMEFLAIPTAHF